MKLIIGLVIPVIGVVLLIYVGMIFLVLCWEIIYQACDKVKKKRAEKELAQKREKYKNYQ
jgi:hypothetical protein